MNNVELQEVISSGVILVDARYINDFSVAEFLTTFTLKLNKLGIAIKIGLIIPFEHSEDMYQKIILECDDKQFDLSYFFYVHSKYNYNQPSSETLKVILEKHSKVLFISQSQKTAFDFSDLLSDYFTIYVRRISFDCNLESFPMIVPVKSDGRPLFSYIHGRSPRFDKIPRGCYIPGISDSVFVDGKEIVLKEKLGDGGEGSVYAIDDEIVAKIYNFDRLTKTRVDKIATMIKRRINDYSICWPISEVKNKDKFVVGYTMKRCIGKPISTLYRGPVVTQQIYPDYSIGAAIKISIMILEKVQKLHKNNVLLGDINDRNFVINDFDEVFLIDTDSYQLEDYSCDVGTIGYIASSR